MPNSPSENPSGLTQDQIERLLALAAQAAANSYSPYSRFRVGAAILLTDGTEVTGCNVENASYRLTSCAEQSAICTAVGLHGPHIRIRAVAVANLNGAASMPCGACRQTILEFAGPETCIFYPDTGGEPACSTIAALLPAAFHLKHLPE